MTTPQIIWMAVSILAGLSIIGLITFAAMRARTARLREHFGSEYDRAIDSAGSRVAAERELADRAKQVKTFDIKALTAAQRAQYRNDWVHIETRFIERPATAVVEADELIGEIMIARGYPMADFDEHAAHLSVQHPKVVDHYRAGHAVIGSQERGTASTEDQRQAMLHYRALFADLVGSGGTDTAQNIVPQQEVTPRTEKVVERTETERELRR
jgi:hypothetical protein